MDMGDLHILDKYEWIILSMSGFFFGIVFGGSLIYWKLTKAFPRKMTKEEALELHHHE